MYFFGRNPNFLERINQKIRRFCQPDKRFWLAVELLLLSLARSMRRVVTLDPSMNPPSENPPIANPRDFAPIEAAPVPADAPDETPSPNAKLWLAPLAVLLLTQIGPQFLPIPNLATALIGVTLLTLVFVGAVVAFALGMARQKFGLPMLLGGCALSAVLYRAADALLAHSRWGGVGQSVTLLLLGTFFGLLVARIIRHANMLGPIGAMVALIDIWGVLFHGIVSKLLTNKSTQGIAHHAMASGPKLGAAASKFHLELPAIGIGDYLFLALFLGVIVRFGMNWRASAIWMWAGVSAALLAIVLVPQAPDLPGLLFLGAGAVLPNLRYFKFTRDERFALLYAGVFVLILTVGLYFGLTAMLPKK